MIRDKFFNNPPTLLTISELQDLLIQTPSLSSAVSTLIDAVSRGAVIPRDFLIWAIQRARNEDLWTDYAWLGQEEVHWVMEQSPERTLSVARPALYHAPNQIIPYLLNAATGDLRPLHSNPEHPLRLIKDWVANGYRRPGEGLERRTLLLAGTQKWLSEGGSPDVGVKSLEIVLSPSFENFTTDPGSGDVVTFTYGYLPLQELQSIQKLWETVFGILELLPIQDWQPLHNALSSWAYPNRFGVTISAEMAEIMRLFARQMLRDIVGLAQNHDGVLHQLKEVSKTIDPETDIPVRPEFAILYPYRDFHEDWKTRQQEQLTAVRELAVTWSKADPKETVKQISLIELEAQAADITWPRLTPELCSELASRATSPCSWLRLMIDASLAGDLITPFLKRAADLNERGWVDFTVECLDNPTLRFVAMWVGLTSSNSPQHLIELVLGNLEGAAQSIGLLVGRGEIPEPIVKQLLRHADPRIARATAWGEWEAKPEYNVRPSLYEDWRRAVINGRTNDWQSGEYSLSQIFQSDPSIAFEWLVACLTCKDLDFMRHEETFKSAIDALDADARLQLLHQMPLTYYATDLVVRLVSDDLRLYQELLGSEQLKVFHLVPLIGGPASGLWVDKAKMALDAGYSFEEVAQSVHGIGIQHFSWSGNESDMWAGWVEKFDQLSANDDVDIKRIAEIGKANAEAARDRALNQEKQWAIYGRS